MRSLVIVCFAPWVAAVAAQAPRTPTDHPAAPAPTTGRSDASTLTETLRPSSTTAPAGRLLGGWLLVPAADLADDPGWGAKRSIYMEDVVTTIDSALGFDWTKKIENTPSGRAFHYIEPFAARQMIRSQQIGPLFA